MLWGKSLTTALSAMAKLGVAELMDGEPVTAEYLAEKTACHAPSLYRVMRMLASLGVFHELEGRRFTLTPVGACLRADSPNSLRALAIMSGDSWQMRGYEYMLHSIRTGHDAITAAYGKSAFDLLPEIPEQAENFHRCMTAYSRMEVAALDPVMDFSGFHRMADVAGGHGMLLSHILRKHPHLHGVLFDLPGVISGAVDAGHFDNCADRVTYDSGSMFERVPHQCDAYIMKHIVHDWGDEHCHKILRLICEQLAIHAPDTGRLFLVEMLIPHGPEPSPAKMLDIEMLVMTIGGKERTVPEFSALFEDAGMELVGVKTTDSPVALIEARVAR
ncbi:MAG TPA: methyltransferase [Bryobacteraceae bacterium]|nr:methyltransferase [Bryobacteraceae bacterium]